VATIFSLKVPADEAFLRAFELGAVPAGRASSAPVLAYFVNETSPNNFPKLPVREGENVFVSFSRKGGSMEKGRLPPEMVSRLAAPPEVHYLSPTARSKISG